MNVPIRRLMAAVLILFALLVWFTSKWSVFDAEDLQAKTENKRPLFEAQQIKRGKITTSDGQVIANSVKEGKNESIQYVRRYPMGELFGNPIGYSFITQGNSGFEQSENSVLTGDDNEFTTLLDQIRGRSQEGSDITTTLDAGAQQVAMDQLSAQESPGSVVAIEPQTGAVRVMASTPGYDPNAIPDDIGDITKADPPKLFNRGLQSVRPPGSTFKVVTAAAALDSGAVSADEPIDSPATMDFSGVPLANDDHTDYPGLTMENALTHSVNTYFAQVGERVGADTLLEYMRRFGFEKDPEVQMPDDQMAASGIFNSKGKLVDDGFDIARVAIGQGGEEGQILATTMQMGEVAATVANGGKLMKPTLVQQVTDPDGRVSDELDPEVQSDVDQRRHRLAADPDDDQRRRRGHGRGSVRRPRRHLRRQDRNGRAGPAGP